MIYYSIINEQTDKKDGSVFTPITPSPAEAAAAEAVASTWKLRYWVRFVCFACSDNGIDCDDIRNNAERPVEELVLKNGVAYGCLAAGHLFIFAEPSTHTFSVTKREGFVGGWGDVCETEHYALTPAETE